MKTISKIILLLAATLPIFAVTAEASSLPSMQILSVTDLMPPSFPQNVQAVGVGSSQIRVTWDNSVDNVSIGGYIVFRDNQLFMVLSNTTFLDTNLPSGTEYSYSVMAFDKAGNFSFVTSPVKAKVGK